MNDIKICEHCGAKLRQYRVPLTKGIIKALVKFRSAVYFKNRNRIHLLKDMADTPYELTRHEWNNFTRLRFHGLVAKYKENGEHVSGYWLITHRGAQFLNGEIQIPESVMIFRNKVVEHSENYVTITNVMKDETIPYFEKRGDIEYVSVEYPGVTFQ